MRDRTYSQQKLDYNVQSKTSVCTIANSYLDQIVPNVLAVHILNCMNHARDAVVLKIRMGRCRLALVFQLNVLKKNCH